MVKIAHNKKTHEYMLKVDDVNGRYSISVCHPNGKPIFSYFSRFRDPYQIEQEAVREITAKLLTPKMVIDLKKSTEEKPLNWATVKVRKVIHQTEKSLKVQLDNGKQAWIAKSLIYEIWQPNLNTSIAVLSVPDWLAEKMNLFRVNRGVVLDNFKEIPVNSWYGLEVGYYSDKLDKFYKNLK